MTCVTLGAREVGNISIYLDRQLTNTVAITNNALYFMGADFTFNGGDTDAEG